MWYGGGIGNNRNASVSVGHLSYMGFIFPNYRVISTKTLSNEAEIGLMNFFNDRIDPTRYGESHKTGKSNPRIGRSKRSRKHSVKRCQTWRQLLLAQ